MGSPRRVRLAACGLALALLGGGCVQRGSSNPDGTPTPVAPGPAAAPPAGPVDGGSRYLPLAPLGGITVETPPVGLLEPAPVAPAVPATAPPPPPPPPPPAPPAPPEHRGTAGTTTPADERPLPVVREVRRP